MKFHQMKQNMYSNNPDQMKNLIINSKEPLIFQNVLDWNMLKWDLDKWNQLLGSEELLFRCGRNYATSEPQWERTTRSRKYTFKEFLSSKNEEEWLYFDYKYLREWLVNIPTLTNGCSWKKFGFPDITGDDCTIWIGNKGAHTPCHVDTYGFNLVAQIFGKKRWILFPPEENLKPTRIPYEESSIYSKLNFFSPNREILRGVGNCRSVVLSPGEVLFLPNGWWHYVENLDVAISINVWLPLPQDNKKRLEEAVVQTLISQLCKDLNSEEQERILNPNSESVIIQQNIRDLVKLVDTCLSRCKNEFASKKLKTEDEEINSRRNYTDYSTETYTKTLPKLSHEEFIKLLENQQNRFTCNEDLKTDDAPLDKIIGATLHPEVINLIISKLLNE